MTACPDPLEGAVGREESESEGADPGGDAQGGPGEQEEESTLETPVHKGLPVLN